MTDLRSKLIYGTIFLLIVSVVQCTTKTQMVKEDDETVLKRRVQEYWSYKVKGEWDKSYLYEWPEYREQVSLVKYISKNGRAPVKWEGFELQEVWTSSNEGHVKLNKKYRYLIPQTQKAVFERGVEEKWVKIDGQWYHFGAAN